jgi:hypothetical protein
VGGVGVFEYTKECKNKMQVVANRVHMARRLINDLAFVLFCAFISCLIPRTKGLDVVVPPQAHIVAGNPWGIHFEETIAPGFALERVELLPARIWSVTARVSTVVRAAYTSNEPVETSTSVLFLAGPGVKIPTDSALVRHFLSAVDTWLPTNATASALQNPSDYALASDLMIGDFDLQTLPTNETLTVSSSVTTHPTIPGVDLVRVVIPHGVFLALQNSSNGTAPRSSITLGVAHLHANAGIGNPVDQIHSGVVWVENPEHDLLSRSFSALTSQKYSFISQTNLQIFETFGSNSAGWAYTAVLTLRFEDGVSNPVFEKEDSVFTIGPSVATRDAVDWSSGTCPETHQMNSLSGCATDLIDSNSSFCKIEPIWLDPVTQTEIIAYRMRVQLSEYTQQPLATDRLFLRFRISALDVEDKPIYSFMNVQTPLLASSIRCGASVVQRQTTDPMLDPVRLSLYSGVSLTPMQKDIGGVAPPIASTSSYALVVSTASNLRVRSILDNVITVALIGDDSVFKLPSLQQINIVDMISIHIRDAGVYQTLQASIRVGSAFSVGELDKYITTSESFDTTCASLPDHCARRELIRAGVVLLPAYTRVATNLADDTTWFNTLFNDATTSDLIAETFTQDAYKVFQPNMMYRRLAWVSTTYQWPSNTQIGLEDHTMILASYGVS